MRDIEIYAMVEYVRMIMDTTATKRKPAGTGIILLNRRNEVLMILRDDNPSIPYPNLWDLPGGHVEPGETPEEAIRREMREEIELELGEIALFREYHNEKYDEWVYVKRIDLDPATIRLHEGQRIEYFSWDRLSTMPLAYSYNKVLCEFFEWMKLEE